MMSKNRKTLFSSRNDTVSVTGSNAVETDRKYDNAEIIESSSAIKLELILVLGIVVAIGLGFGAIYASDMQFGWVENTSEIIAKALIKSY